MSTFSSVLAYLKNLTEPGFGMERSTAGGLQLSGEGFVTRVLYVDGGRGDSYTEDGTAIRPYKTIQAAVNYAEASLSPAYDNPVSIHIMPLPGDVVYRETVVIKRDGISLIGDCAGWSGRVGIERVIVTNATAASLATFIGNDGINYPADHYDDLAQDSYEPWAVQLKSLNLGDLDTYTTNALMYLGVGAGNDMGSYELGLSEVGVMGTAYIRGICYAWNWDETFFSDTLTIHNIGSLGFSATETWGNLNIEKNVSDDLPSVSDTKLSGRAMVSGNVSVSGSAKLSIWCRNWLIHGNLDVDDTADVTLKNSCIDGSVLVENDADVTLKGVHVDGDLDLDDTAALVMDGSFVDGNITVENFAAFYLSGVHVQGNIDLDYASGAASCFYDGGRYIGTLTDPGSRLTRNVGN
jgi:hypothetical protein